MMHKILGGLMTYFMIFLASFLSISAAPSSQLSWEKWKSDYEKKHVGPETSYLNAISLEQTTDGQKLYLVLGSTKKSTKWVKIKPKNYSAVAEHKGDEVILSIGKQKPIILSENKRRHHFSLKNGAVAEAVFGKRVGKLWGYIYNPKQIKSFTGFRFYPYNPKAVVKAIYKKPPDNQDIYKSVTYKTVQGDPAKVFNLGQIVFKLGGKTFSFNAYNWQKKGETLSYLALVFVDPAAGKKTYAGGREVVIEFSGGLPKDGAVLDLDFNKTQNFYCAHNPFWHCPVGLQQSIRVPVLAGEMLPLKKVFQRR